MVRPSPRGLVGCTRLPVPSSARSHHPKSGNGGLYLGERAEQGPVLREGEIVPPEEMAARQPRLARPGLSVRGGRTSSGNQASLGVSSLGFCWLTGYQILDKQILCARSR